MPDFKDRKKIFIIAPIRTGTTFFGKKLRDVIPNSVSFSEPDNFWDPDRWVEQILHQGLKNIFFLKLLGLTGARNISRRRLAGKITKDQALNQFIKERTWTDKYDEHFYIEANYQLFGLADDLLSLPNSKIVLFSRHPYTWLRSAQHHEYADKYSKKGLTYNPHIGVNQITPKNMGIDDPDWDSYEPIEKLCWLWNFVNKIFWDTYQKRMHEGERMRFYKFEDIFEEKNSEKIRDFLSFVSEGSDDLDNIVKSFMKSQGQKINSSFSQKNQKPTLPDSDLEMADKLCGDLMKKIGY